MVCAFAGCSSDWLVFKACFLFYLVFGDWFAFFVGISSSKNYFFLKTK